MKEIPENMNKISIFARYESEYDGKTTDRKS